MTVPNSVMPKGVEHIVPVAVGRQAHGVPNSVMPKGVEHMIRRRPNRGCTVPNSVMPKGVEHGDAGRVDSAHMAVSNSVMPKGVEHRCGHDGLTSPWRAEFSDAERR